MDDSTKQTYKTKYTLYNLTVAQYPNHNTPNADSTLIRRAQYPNPRTFFIAKYRVRGAI